MSFIPSRLSTQEDSCAEELAKSKVQLSYIDILYDHVEYLSGPNHDDQIGPDDSMKGHSVCVVGAGPAGLVSAHLLNRQGADVTVFESSGRVGGRVYSDRPLGPTSSPIFEMGAMRVPPSERIFNYYADKIGMTGVTFPDPGKVPTKIVFQNTAYDFSDKSHPPMFDNVIVGWVAFVNMLMEKVGNLLMDSSDFAAAEKAWQKMIYEPVSPGPEKGYSLISFYQGVVQAFVENPGALEQYNNSNTKIKPWSERDLALFGALGLGSGGFGPLYQVNFAEICRLVVNGLESDQKLYENGLDELPRWFESQLSNPVEFGTKVTGVVGATGSNKATVSFIPKGATASRTQTFDAVIVATTNRSMQIDMGLTDSASAIHDRSDEVNSAIRELHLMNSSKLFVLTKTKFWKHNKVPQNIQSDGLVRGLYGLEYPRTDHGVVLVSYTWGVEQDFKALCRILYSDHLR